ncbi:MAG: phosphopantothenate/pantothenate synthetase [Thermoplasmata archaeon]|jgi:4-phosphopantoate--beta-alanine ligase|nr:phosphopantothenate/pantothenate synthetase [Thermoplasmata archaeon]
MTDIPKSHPRYQSLVLREKLVEGFGSGLVVPQGLIAHGRGEMFDYLIGERTTKEARAASRAAAATILKAKRPVISVNGNVAALCPSEVAELAVAADARIEVGLFHRTDERVRKIQKTLEDHGAEDVLGFLPDAAIPGLDHLRALCSREGIFSADVVLIPLEDGDRAEALAKMGKKTVAIDLNPMSRTSRNSTVSIVDEVTRAIPELRKNVEDLDGDAKGIKNAISSYDRDENLAMVMKAMSERLGKLKER